MPTDVTKQAQEKLREAVQSLIGGSSESPNYGLMLCHAKDAKGTRANNGKVWATPAEVAAELDRILGHSELLAQRDELVGALKKIAAQKPKRRPEWHEDTGNNFDDSEANGYDIAAWDLAEEAESALRRLEGK